MHIRVHLSHATEATGRGVCCACLNWLGLCPKPGAALHCPRMGLGSGITTRSWPCLLLLTHPWKGPTLSRHPGTPHSHLLSHLPTCIPDPHASQSQLTQIYPPQGPWTCTGLTALTVCHHKSAVQNSHNDNRPAQGPALDYLPCRIVPSYLHFLQRCYMVFYDRKHNIKCVYIIACKTISLP